MTRGKNITKMNQIDHRFAQFSLLKVGHWNKRQKPGVTCSAYFPTALTFEKMRSIAGVDFLFPCF